MRNCASQTLATRRAYADPEVSLAPPPGGLIRLRVEGKNARGRCAWASPNGEAVAATLAENQRRGKKDRSRRRRGDRASGINEPETPPPSRRVAHASPQRCWGEEERRHGTALTWWRCRGIYWRHRCTFSHKAWNHLLYALYGNRECDVTVFSCNARGLPVNADHPKWQWIFEQVDQWCAQVVVICELEGGNEEYKTLRKVAGRKGYDLRWLVGE